MEAGAKTTQLDHWQRIGASYAAEWEPPARSLRVTGAMLHRLLGGPRLAREIFVVASR